MGDIARHGHAYLDVFFLQPILDIVFPMNPILCKGRVSVAVLILLTN